jgi:hypothetical protein
LHVECNLSYTDRVEDEFRDRILDIFLDKYRNVRMSEVGRDWDELDITAARVSNNTTTTNSAFSLHSSRHAASLLAAPGDTIRCSQDASLCQRSSSCMGTTHLHRRM